MSRACLAAILTTAFLVAALTPATAGGYKPGELAWQEVVALLGPHGVPAPAQSVKPVDNDCEYGYGSCTQYCPTVGDYCDPGYRPCFEDSGCWCKWFPECN